MYQRADSTSTTGPVLKGAYDGNSAALAGIFGKRVNINGDGRVNQRLPGATVNISGSWQYFQDMWEVEALTPANVSGAVGQIADTTFPAGVSMGFNASLTTTGAVTIAFRTKIESRNVAHLLSAPFQYPVSAPAHPFGAISILAFQDSGANVNVTPILRSADAVDNFSSMSNSLTGNAITLGSGALTQIAWDTAANALQLDSLTNFRNGVVLELQFAMPTGLSGKNLRFGDVQFEGGQVASYFGRALFADELWWAQRYWAKTFPLAVAPAQNAGTAGAFIFPQGVAAATAQKGNQWQYPAHMIKAPAVTFFNPSAANAQVRNLDSASDCSATASDVVSETAASFNTTTPASTAAGQRLAVHLVADASL